MKLRQNYLETVILTIKCDKNSVADLTENNTIALTPIGINCASEKLPSSLWGFNVCILYKVADKSPKSHQISDNICHLITKSHGFCTPVLTLNPDRQISSFNPEKAGISLNPVRVRTAAWWTYQVQQWQADWWGEYCYIPSRDIKNLKMICTIVSGR